MKKLPYLICVVIALALLVTESAGSVSSRKKEKSAVYATLLPWQKKNVDNGIVAVTFTPDMVYMAVGNPSEKKTAKDGELWIYKNYYPSEGAQKVKYTLTTERNMDHSFVNSVLMEPSGGPIGGVQRPVGATQGSLPSIARTGGVQGGSMEPADLPSYTFYVGFQNGVVSQMRLDPN